MLSFGRTGYLTSRTVAYVALWVLLPLACRDKRAVLDISVSKLDELPPIVRVDVTATHDRRVSMTTVRGSTESPVTWPVAVNLNVAGLASGNTLIEAIAFDSTQTMVARGTSSVTLPYSKTVSVELRCQSLVCRPIMDAGTDAGPDGGVDGNGAADAESDGMTSAPACGNGRLDPGELCDIGRASDLPGACPMGCDDGIPCTRDQKLGDACTLTCSHVEITAAIPGDSCCPAGATNEIDSDCSTTCGNQRIDPGETCDMGIVAGTATCPTVDACDDEDPCTVDQLISAGTCAARCTHTAIPGIADGDGCCPLPADATTDSDCRSVCGNGILESGELCDPAAPPDSGGCQILASCDDHNPCTIDSLAGVGCRAVCSHRTIATPVPGDGCCPAPGLAKNIDSDCSAVCGNGVWESGETCDMALAYGTPGACPASCPVSSVACVRSIMHGTAADCSADCTPTPVAACSAISDNCCPTGCTRANDPDCSATCGNGVVDPGETCDVSIASGAGVCPKTCADGVACTDDLLVDGSTCNARCVFVPTTTLRNGDGCCPAGSHAGIDADCPATCGNGVVETPWETCDTGTAPTSCPAACPPPEACAVWTRTVTSGCDVRCTRQSVAGCANGDGCCAPGCNAANDSDCHAICGNGILEPSEACDRKITAGHAGACPTFCADSDPCTQDFARGNAESCTRTCSHVRVTACGGGDRCCPAGCSAANDNDCAPSCGDSQVQAGETCDPMATCPTSCASDGDPCTVDQLIGSSATCNAACAHVPILRCSGAQKDGCCPTECGTASDSDC
jgi:hypothetical protein